MTGDYYFIINPAAGRGKKLSFLSELTRLCRAQQVLFQTVITKHPKQATELSRQAVGSYGTIVAVGGDGTVNEVANGVMGSNVRFGILPIGTGNDTAHQLGYSRNLAKDMHILFRGETKSIDSGLVNKSRYFVNGFGIGFDGETARGVRSMVKHVSGFPAYIAAVLRTLLTYRVRDMEISFDTESYQRLRPFLFAVCNGTTYGGGFRVAPSAKMDDGLFTTCLVDRVSRWYAARHLPMFLRGQHVKLPEVHMRTARHVRIRADKRHVAQIDGEILSGQAQYDIAIQPNSLRVIYQP